MKLRRLDIFISVLALAVLPACGGGSKMLKEPVALELGQPLTVAADATLAVTLDWVIVKDGPGTWAKNAWWDEYLLQVVNQSGDPVSISAIQVVDYLDTPLATGLNRKQLVKASKRTAKRYREYDVEVRPGAGTGALLALGTGTFVVAGAAAGASVAAGVASALTLGTSTASAPAALMVAGPVALLATPVFVVGGVVKGVRNSRVDKEIGNRQTALPVQLPANGILALTAFFPVAPSPRLLQVIYETPVGNGVLEVDTREVLDGLHMSDRSPTDQHTL